MHLVARNRSRNAAKLPIVVRMLSIRPWTTEDLPKIAEYFCRGTDEFYEQLGIDRTKVPKPEAYARALAEQLAKSGTAVTAFYNIWEVEGRAVGHSSLKDIRYGEFGSQHLHTWEPLARGKGFGPILFCLSTIDFFSRFNLKELICEPSAKNPSPNRMLTKVGFEKIGSRVAASSDIAKLCEINTYRIDREVAERYLCDHREFGDYSDSEKAAR